ncbi:MAG: hypothetical protein J2P16_00490 [Mycobacterium sp.]|nr:hypothetical protein [Mycobacterium sp.]
MSAEARALRHLATKPLRGIVVPQVIDHSQWASTEVLVMTVLRPGRRVRRAGAALNRAMREVADWGRLVPTDASSYLDATRTSAVSGSERDGPDRFEQWVAMFDLIVEQHAVADLQLGAWHGDWTEWNCAADRGMVAVWDWERFGLGVPCGFDKLHFTMCEQVGPRRDRFLPAAMELIEDAPEILAPWRLRRDAARTTAMLYILHLALRYLLDAAPRHSAIGRVEEWAYPAIRSALAGSNRED